MRLDDLIDFLEAKVPYTYYKNSFPSAASDNCAYIRLTGGEKTRKSGIKEPSLQIVVRSDDVNVTEDISYRLFKKLTNLQEVKIGDESVVIIRCRNSSPMYIGTDENDRTIYSINFEMVVR